MAEPLAGGERLRTHVPICIHNPSSSSKSPPKNHRNRHTPNRSLIATHRIIAVFFMACTHACRAWVSRLPIITTAVRSVNSKSISNAGMKLGIPKGGLGGGEILWFHTIGIEFIEKLCGRFQPLIGALIAQAQDRQMQGFQHGCDRSEAPADRAAP